MNVRYCSSVSTIQNARNQLNIAAQYHSRMNREKNAKLDIAKGNLNVDNTYGRSHDGLHRIPSCAVLMFS